MTVELWDTTSGNIIDSFPSEAEALVLVRRYLAEDGPNVVAELGLLIVENDREQVIKGDSLVSLARQVSFAPG